VSMVTAVNEGGNAVITINPKGDYEYLAYQTDNLFTVSVKPISAADLEKKRKDAFNYTGEKLSLNFQDIEVRSVLQLIADFTELNLVASDSVEGRITLRLQNVPWDQALDLVLKTKGLDKRKVGNVILVAPASEIAEREKLELETTKQVEELAPLRTEYLQVNYAKAADLAELITADNGFLTDRGTATVDPRTNTILVQDTSAKLEEIRQLLKQLDVPVKQVLIESRIVVARQSVGEEMGVQWGQFREDQRPDGSKWYTAPRNDMVRQMYNNDARVARGDDPQDVTGDTLSVDLASPSSNAASFAIGYLRDGTLIDMELSALESTGNVNILATPKLLTADQQKAKIESGREIPYQEASSSGATTITFKKAVLALEVTPHITPDGRIIMELQINQDSVGENVVVASTTGGSSTSVPSIDTNKIQTSVLVDDGETVVLGGVFKNEATDTVYKVPFLGDLPVLGRLFRSNTKSELKQELLIFITPKVVHNVIAQQ
ncbi:MAG TPA: type IV pilus secretin PilQ family protein, partial [Pseudomonadales bacterium]|nr:type IV pilus secretin PilQ family protein [Pseudomonadales bacterium]